MAMIGGEAKARAARDSAEPFWREMLRVIPAAGPTEALDIFQAARAHYEHAVSRHVLTLFALVQPVFKQVSKLAANAPQVAAALQAGYGGHQESEMLACLWACAKGRLSIDKLLERHGYQGPRGGELSAVVWREDRKPLEVIIKNYRSMPDDEDLSILEQRNSEQREAAEIELVRSLPRRKRGQARLVLRLARRYMPLRSIGKVSCLQCFDVARAAARRIGQHLESTGVIDQQEDVFYLTAEELPGASRIAARELVQERRRHEAEYRAVSVPPQ